MPDNAMARPSTEEINAILEATDDFEVAMLVLIRRYPGMSLRDLGDRLRALRERAPPVTPGL